MESLYKINPAMSFFMHIYMYSQFLLFNITLNKIKRYHEKISIFIVVASEPAGWGGVEARSNPPPPQRCLCVPFQRKAYLQTIHEESHSCRAKFAINVTVECRVDT